MTRLSYFFLIVAGLWVRLLVLLHTKSIGGDCAVFGLMAKQISELKEFPIYLWLAHYSGTLSAYLIAVCFRLFGISAMSYMITGLLVSSLLAWLCFMAARKIFPDSDPLFATALVLVPPANVLSLTFLYQYGDTLVFVCLALILLMRLSEPDKRGNRVLWAELGLFSGIGLWLSPHFLPILIVEAIFLWVRGERPRFNGAHAAWAAGFLAGYFPAIFYNIQHPGAQAMRMAGRFLDLGRADMASPHLVRLVTGRFIRRILSVPVSLFRVPALFAELSGWLDCIAFAAAGLWLWRRKDSAPHSDGLALVGLMSLVCVLFYAIFVGENESRLVFPLYLAFALTCGRALSSLRQIRPRTCWILLATILFVNSVGLASGLRREGTHYKELADYLLSNNLTRGYSDEWIAYPVIFHSEERVIISPTLFHPTFGDRRPEYTRIVRDAQSPILVLDRNKNAANVPRVESELARLDVSFKKKGLYEFFVFWDLSRKIYPEELVLRRGP
jgi:hypothetical protein